jgi:hypothetical protein
MIRNQKQSDTGHTKHRAVNFARRNCQGYFLYRFYVIAVLSGDLEGSLLGLVLRGRPGVRVEVPDLFDPTDHLLHPSPLVRKNSNTCHCNMKHLYHLILNIRVL